MKIIGYLKDDDKLFLIDDGVISLKWRGRPCARVLDMNDHLLYPALPLISLCARDDWRMYSGKQSNLPQWLQRVRDIQ